MTKQEFYSKYLPYAKESSQLLGGKLDPYIILAFWHWESAGGTNLATTKLNNLGGINWVGQSKYGINATQSPYGKQEYANYATLSDFAKDFARVMSLGYYKDTLLAGQTEGYKDDVIAHNASPYAGGDYNITTVVDNANAFRTLAGKGTVVDDTNFITVPNTNNLSLDEITKAIAIGVAVLGIVALIKD